MDGRRAARGDVLAKAARSTSIRARSPAGTCAQSVFGHVNALFYRHDARRRSRVLVARSFARDAWQSLCASAAQYGYDVLRTSEFPAADESNPSGERAGALIASVLRVDLATRRLELAAFHFAVDTPARRRFVGAGSVCAELRRPSLPRRAARAVRARRRVLVLAAVALRLDDDDAVGGDSLVVARERAAPSPRREATTHATSKRRWSAVETLLTFCPPARCARIADHSISFGGIRIIAEPADLTTPSARARRSSRTERFSSRETGCCSPDAACPPRNARSGRARAARACAPSSSSATSSPTPIIL